MSSRSFLEPISADQTSSGSNVSGAGMMGVPVGEVPMMSGLVGEHSGQVSVPVARSEKPPERKPSA